ncbi:hypothetical protein BaRGS_00008707 [Batillaria attramentaria]|uniref:Uncharacterized protein n=1 Tax=Batillaria attramentaria TaxID=370345 RepID=A0ABD0LLG3_9CAEN
MKKSEVSGEQVCSFYCKAATNIVSVKRCAALSPGSLCVDCATVIMCCRSYHTGFVLIKFNLKIRQEVRHNSNRECVCVRKFATVPQQSVCVSQQHQRMCAMKCATVPQQSVCVSQQHQRMRAMKFATVSQQNVNLCEEVCSSGTRECGS